MTGEKDVFTLCQAAAELDVPKRTFYAWAAKKKLPLLHLTANRRVMLRQHVRRVRTTLETGGREAILSGNAVREPAAA